MKKFLDDNFLLDNKNSEELYHNYAAEMPIIDYHSHLQPKEIVHDRKFESITEAWLEGDHYKWRAMRTNGINEKYITGSAIPEEKFEKWAETVPQTVRNPLYHWTHLELKRYFGIEKLLNKDSSSEIFCKTSEMLKQDSYGCQGILLRMNVETVCTTDDPTDTLGHHKKLNRSDFPVQVLPTFRPDKAYAVEDVSNYNTYLDELTKVSGTKINTLSDLLSALEHRIKYFHEHGCRLSDHGIEQFYVLLQNGLSAEAIFKKIRTGTKLEKEEVVRLKQTILHELAKMYHNKSWVQQYHLGAIRNANSRMMRELGPDTGFDSIGDFAQGKALALFLDGLDATNQLAKTVLYNLNPRDNELIGTMIGNFNDGSIAGKMQFGSAWWFLDQKDGMEKQLNTLSNMGLLSRFVGMLTDSRSFLSFPRHEYFRRILCNLIGKDVQNGELPNDMKLLGGIVQNICYHNAKAYFNFESKKIHV
ncbi:MAG: glucuronate isomerase [Bacteroidota bacterium]